MVVPITSAWRSDASSAPSQLYCCFLTTEITLFRWPGLKLGSEKVGLYAVCPDDTHQALLKKSMPVQSGY